METPMDKNSSYPNKLNEEYTMKSDNLDLNDNESIAELSMVSYSDINNIVVMKEEEMGIDETHHLDAGIFIDNLEELKNECIEEIYLEDEENNDTHTLSSSELFSCNVCNMDFHSVQDHINEYHQNQTVELKMDTIDGNKNKINTYSNSMIKIEKTEDDTDNFETKFDEYIIDTLPNSIPEKKTNKEVNSNLPDKKDTKISVPTLNAENDESQKIYACRVCEVLFRSMRALSAHMRVHKNRSIEFVENSYIERKIKKPVKLPAAKSLKEKKSIKTEKSQLKTKINENITTIFNCEICNTTFQTIKSLKLHSRIHNPVIQKTFEQAAEFELKLCENDSNADNEQFYCEICDKSYSSKFEIMHTQMHSGEIKHICQYCNKKFNTESNLLMHLSVHPEVRNPGVQKPPIPSRSTNIAKLQYPCNYCGKLFMRPHEKVKHERIHTGEKPYECEICGKTFRVTYCLTLHMRTHTTARPYVCIHCNKRFKAHSVYNHHLLIHSDVRAYQCPFCPKTFKTSVQLAGHKNSHTKPFSCTECNRPFATLYAVRSHMETHNKTNHNLKYSCDICGATYARGFALKDHVKEQHPDVPIDKMFALKSKSNIDKKKITSTNSDYNDDEQFNIYITPDDHDVDEITSNVQLLDDVSRNMVDNVNDIIVPDDELHITISGIDQFANEEIVSIAN